LPKAGAEPLPIRTQKDQPPVILSINSEGLQFLNTDKPDVALNDAQLLQAVQGALAADPLRDVLVRADTRVPYGRVVGAMVVLQNAGATKLGFLTDPEPLAPETTP
jgi:biopolymer transport protein TolR